MIRPTFFLQRDLDWSTYRSDHLRFCDFAATKPKYGKKAAFKRSKAFKVAGNASKGKVTYKLAKVPKKAKKYVKLTAGGKLTVRKGIPKGTYKVKVRVAQAATANYEGKVIKGVTLKIRVR